MTAGSSFFASPEAHTYWLGHPAQPSTFPAKSEFAPTHP